jgi:hypothetical protein
VVLHSAFSTSASPLVGRAAGDREPDSGIIADLPPEECRALRGGSHRIAHRMKTAVLLLAVAAATAQSATLAQRAPGRMNVVMLVIDDTRWDSIVASGTGSTASAGR